MKAVLMKKIDGFDRYYISKEGEIMDTDYRRTGVCRIIKPSTDKNGYKVISLFENGRMRQKLIHRLIAQTYIPNPYNLPVINHKDENKSNNCIDNLEWCSVGYNNCYGSRLNKLSDKMSKKVYGYNDKGELVKTFKSVIEGKKNGYWHIAASCNGKRKTCGGLRWSYEKL